jgi:UBX domain-containing protein 1
MNFVGRGQRLGDQNESQGSSSRDTAPSVPTVTRLMTFWSEGFSIEDGPLLRYDDSQNKGNLYSLISEFLAAIQSG